MNSRPRNGKVYLVGAGPGDPGLLTIKGLEKLKLADVVVYDRLINDDLLSYCKADCERIFVGKESGYHPIEQEQISEIMTRKAELGLTVVRLKGGNPFVFGRGSEEAIALKDAGIDYEIIPGITSGLSAPVYSGIPVTHRGMITQCVLITAHESPDKKGTQVEWEKLAALKNSTLIIYMGASRIQSICNELMKYGMDPSMPSAVIENGTLPKQRTITGRLDSIAGKFEAKGFHAPAIIIISQTVSMRDRLSWFETRPLFGKRTVISAERDALDSLRAIVSDLGGEAIVIPANSNTAVEKISQAGAIDHVDGTSTAGGFERNDFLLRESPLAPSRSVFTAVAPEPVRDPAEEIIQEGAEVFIFSTSTSVERLFDTIGHEPAFDFLGRGISIAMTRNAFDCLVGKNIRSTGIFLSESPEQIRDLVLNIFS